MKLQRCKKHGLTDHYEWSSKFKCKRCNVEAVTRNRRRRKFELVEIFGGVCLCCGYSSSQRALQYHHLNPKEKEFSLSQKGVCRSFEKYLKEARKCVLVCGNCHAEIEDKIRTIADEQILKQLKIVDENLTKKFGAFA